MWRRTNDRSVPDGWMECFLGLTRVITRPCATMTTYNISYNVLETRSMPSLNSLTLIFDVGTSVSAMRFRRVGSILRQCNDDVLIARSHSNLPRSEYRKGSAPVQGE